MPDGTASLELAGACLTALLCFDDLGGRWRPRTRRSRRCPPPRRCAPAIEALTAWHLWLLGDLAGAERHARAAWAGPETSPRAPAGLALPLSRTSRPPSSRSSRPSAGISPPPRAPDVAVAARDAGTVAWGAAHAARHVRRRSRAGAARRPRAAVARCMAGLEFARDWRDSSLMVPATLLELSRAYAAAGDTDAATAAVRAARARVNGARDAGVLAARPSLRAVDGVDELSAREVEVLDALARPGSLREVADQLFISRNTIKTHTRALYAKLGVASRDEAVERAARSAC